MLGSVNSGPNGIGGIVGIGGIGQNQSQQQVTDLQSQLEALNKQLSQQIAMSQIPPTINYQPSQQWQAQLTQAQNRPPFQGLLNGYTPRQAPLPQSGNYQGFNAAPINPSALSAKYLSKGSS